MSTEQTTIPEREPDGEQHHQNPQKGALNLAEIQQQDRHGNHMGSSFTQSRGNKPHAAFPFCQAESALYLYAFTFIQTILCFVPVIVLPRPAQCRTG